MTHTHNIAIALCFGVTLGLAVPAHAQLGGIAGGLSKAKGIADKAQDAKNKIDEFIFTDAEEQQLGAKVSDMLREKYGVMQDKAVHRYVTLVGMTLAQASSRPTLKWQFIVLDTDGVNAFAAPGGFIHITRGALALAQNEAELADVLGHEISHVTEQHTINAIRKAKAVEMGAQQIRTAFLDKVAEKAYEMTLENQYDRKDEMDADQHGIVLANKAGYAPTGLAAFLTRLSERNKDLKDPSGIFASHPETKARVDQLTKVIGAEKLTAAALAAARFHQAITFKPVAVSVVASAVSGSAGLTSGKPAPAAAKPDDKAAGKTDPKADPKASDPKPAGGKFGLGGLNPLGKEKASTQTVSSAGSRGVNPDRDAKGGANSSLVIVTVTAAELAEFKKGIV